MTNTEKVDDLRNRYFPVGSHPYRKLDRTVQKYIEPSFTVLEVGCGRKAPLLHKFRQNASKVIGIDVVDFTETNNDFELYKNDITDMKDISTRSIDICFSRSVMEHVLDTDKAFSEINRVLNPGGRYIFLTPNFFDYASIIAAIVPNFLHPKIVRMTEGRAEENTFPTHFNCNTRRTIERLSAKNGFEIEEFEYLGQYPNYFNFNATLFKLGCLYAEFLERHPSLHPLKGWIFCVIRKRN
jgi:SAM-dependent methyltransferase